MKSYRKGLSFNIPSHRGLVNRTPDVEADLRKKKVREEDLEPFLGSVMMQAQVLYTEWPVGVDTEN